MRALLYPLALLLALLSACDPVAPELAELRGTWAAEPYRWSDGWSPRRMDRKLVLTGGGRFTWETLSYGAYRRPERELTAFSRVRGTFRREGDRLLFTPEELETWDSFYGKDSPVQRRPYPYGRIFEDCTFRLEGDRLTLTYTTYPADGPVATTSVYRRAD